MFNHDKKLLDSIETIDVNVYENMIQLIIDYCKQCKDVGYAEIIKFDENGRSTKLLRRYPVDRKHFEGV